MKQPTVEQILASNSYGFLSYWAANWCNGWRQEIVEGEGKCWLEDSKTLMLVSHYNPCKTEGQAIALAEKYELEIDFEAKCVTYGNDFRFWFSDENNESYESLGDPNFVDTWMTGVVKASLCSVVSA